MRNQFNGQNRKDIKFFNMDFAKVFLLVFVIHLAAGNVIRKKRSDTVIAGGNNKYIFN